MHTFYLCSLHSVTLCTHPTPCELCTVIRSLPGYLSLDTQAESARSNIKQSSPWLDICVLHQNIGADRGDCKLQSP